MENESFWTGIPGILTALAGLLAAVGSLVGVLHTTGVLRRKAPAAATEPTEDSPSAVIAVSADAGHAPSADAPVEAPSPPVILRSAPAILSPEKLSAMLVRRGFFDKRRNPIGNPASTSYERRVDGEMLMVLDGVTGLTWEMGGSSRPMTFDDAPAHVDRLNAERAGGYADWRIPTAEEVMSLMTPDASDGFHIAPEFRKETYFVWTADQVDAGRGWVVYFADGSIEIESREFNAWVRAVR